MENTISRNTPLNSLDGLFQQMHFYAEGQAGRPFRPTAKSNDDLQAWINKIEGMIAYNKALATRQQELARGPFGKRKGRLLAMGLSALTALAVIAQITASIWEELFAVTSNQSITIATTILDIIAVSLVSASIIAWHHYGKTLRRLRKEKPISTLEIKRNEQILKVINPVQEFLHNTDKDEAALKDALDRFQYEWDYLPLDLKARYPLKGCLVMLIEALPDEHPMKQAYRQAQEKTQESIVDVKGSIPSPELGTPKLEPLSAARLGAKKASSSEILEMAPRYILHEEPEISGRDGHWHQLARRYGRTMRFLTDIAPVEANDTN